MSELNPRIYLRITSDGYIQVRNDKGELLGCISGTPPQEAFIQTPIGAVEVRAAVMWCLVPTAEQIVKLFAWDGFIPATIPPGLSSDTPYTKGDEP